MPGPIALHGGGEFQLGDEPFLRAILEAAVAAARWRAAGRGTGVAGDRAPTVDDTDPAAVRVAIVPAAAAAERPDLAVANGIAAFERVARAARIAALIEGVMAVDARTAASPAVAERLAAADLVYLPGGDPGHLVATLEGSMTWRSIGAARARGGVLAGASAGAMVLAPWTWAPRGGRPGLGLVPDLVVVPHAARVRAGGWAGTFAERLPTGLGLLGRLGLEERTGVISGALVPGGRAWRVVGEGAVYWSAPGERTIRAIRSGETVILPG
jgi:cyanophycinase-like exopeptidase